MSVGKQHRKLKFGSRCIEDFLYTFARVGVLPQINYFLRNLRASLLTLQCRKMPTPGNQSLQHFASTTKPSTCRQPIKTPSQTNQCRPKDSHRMSVADFRLLSPTNITGRFEFPQRAHPYPISVQLREN